MFLLVKVANFNCSTMIVYADAGSGQTTLITDIWSSVK